MERPTAKGWLIVLDEGTPGWRELKLEMGRHYREETEQNGEGCKLEHFWKFSLSYLDGTRVQVYSPRLLNLYGRPCSKFGNVKKLFHRSLVVFDGHTPGFLGNISFRYTTDRCSFKANRRFIEARAQIVGMVKADTA